jgi:hypothetical protein
MSDPTIDRVEAAVEEARKLLEIYQLGGALGKNRDPDRGLRRAAHSYVARLTDEAMPERLRKYVCRMLEEAKPLDRSTYFQRDLWITFNVNQIVRLFGFAPTRNAESRRKGREESACSIVATALRKLGVHLSERTIEDMWAMHRPSLGKSQGVNPIIRAVLKQLGITGYASKPKTSTNVDENEEDR